MESVQVVTPAGSRISQRVKLLVVALFVGTVLFSLGNINALANSSWSVQDKPAPVTALLDCVRTSNVTTDESAPVLPSNSSASSEVKVDPQTDIDESKSLADDDDDAGYEKLNFLDSIPNLHPLVKEQWKKYNKSLDDNGRMSKECVQRAARFKNDEIPDVKGMYYRDYLAVFRDTRNQDFVRDLRETVIENGQVKRNHDFWYRENSLANFLNDLYRDNPDLPDITFWQDLNDGALCAPWLTEDCAIPFVVHESGMECAALLGTSRPTVEGHVNHFQEPDWNQWDGKKEVAIWRGSTTGGLDWNMDFQNGARFKLVSMSLDHPELLDARFTGYVQGNNDLRNYLQSSGRLCTSCRIDSGRWPEWKYLVVVDGNSNPDRFPFFLATGSVVLRQEWIGLEVFEYGLKPWEHYIPVKRDLSDLLDKIEWAKSHDDECRQIAKNAYKYIDQAFTHTANVEYWKGFIKAYAEIVPRL